MSFETYFAVTQRPSPSKTTSRKPSRTVEVAASLAPAFTSVTTSDFVSGSCRMSRSSVAHIVRDALARPASSSAVGSGRLVGAAFSAGGVAAGVAAGAGEGVDALGVGAGRPGEIAADGLLAHGAEGRGGARRGCRHGGLGVGPRQGEGDDAARPQTDQRERDGDAGHADGDRRTQGPAGTRTWHRIPSDVVIES